MPAPIANPTYLPPKRVTALSGYATTASAKVGVYTLLDPTTDPVSFVCDGTTYSTANGLLTLTARGSPTICWTGGITVSNLAPHTRYPWTVTQGTWTDSGTLASEPEQNDDFDVFFWSCDRNTSGNVNFFNQNPEKVPGYWQHQRRHVEAGGVFATIFVDDFGYVDFCNIKDDGSQYTFPNQSGLVSSGQPSTTLALNDYLIGWCAMLGMVGPEQTEYDPVNELGAAYYLYILSALWGRESNRHYCLRNTNLYIKDGDHELSNNLGFDVKLVNDYPNARFASAGVAGVGKVAFDAFFGQLVPPPILTRLDTVATHWVASMGPLAVAAPDRTSSAVGNIAMSYSPPTTGITIFGTNQIDDILAEVGSLNRPMTLLCLSVGLRYLGAGPNYSIQYGDQHPLFNHALPEFQRLITGTANASLMNSAKTNGLIGCSVVLHGDTHHPEARKFQAAAYTGNAQENLYMITHGGSNASHSTTPKSPEVTAENQVISDCLIAYDAAYHPSMSDLGYSTDTDLSPHGIRVSVFGSRYPVEMVIELRNFLDEVAWTRKWAAHNGNGGLDVTTPVQAFPKISRSSVKQKA